MDTIQEAIDQETRTADRVHQQMADFLEQWTAEMENDSDTLDLNVEEAIISEWIKKINEEADRCEEKIDRSSGKMTPRCFSKKLDQMKEDVDKVESELALLAEKAQALPGDSQDSAPKVVHLKQRMGEAIAEHKARISILKDRLRKLSEKSINE